MNEVGMDMMFEQYELIKGMSSALVHGGLIRARYERTDPCGCLILTAERTGSVITVKKTERDPSGGEETASAVGRRGLLSEIESVWDECGMDGPVPVTGGSDGAVTSLTLTYRDGQEKSVSGGSSLPEKIKEGLGRVRAAMEEPFKEPRRM